MFRPSLARLAFLRFVQCSWLRWDSVGKRVKGGNSTVTVEVPPTRPVGDTLPQHVSLPQPAQRGPSAPLLEHLHLVHTWCCLVHTWCTLHTWWHPGASL